MKRFFKYFGIGIGLLFTLSLVVVIYVATLDPNDHKPWITQKFFEETGRRISLDGDISLSLFPWLGLHIERVSISDDSDFSTEPFFSTDLAHVRIKLSAMLSNEFEIDTIRLHNTRLNLIVDENGRGNWESLSQGEPEATPAEPETEGFNIPHVIVGGIDIRNFNLSYEDRMADTRYSVENLNLETDALVYGDPIPLSLSLLFNSSAPELSADINMNATVNYDLNGQAYSISPLSLNAQLSGPTVPQGSASLDLDTALDLDLAAGTLDILSLQLDALGTSLNASVQGRDINSERPVYDASLVLEGSNLADLFRLVDNTSLAQQIEGFGNRSFSVNSQLSMDMARGDVQVPSLAIRMLGASIDGNLSASNIHSDAMQVRGNLSAAGPDLPMLLEVAGMVSGGQDAPLTQYGRALATQADRSFTLETVFDANLESGNVQIPVLGARGLGIDLSGQLQANNMQEDDGTVDGSFELNGRQLKPLLGALELHAPAEILEQLSVNASISGSRNNITINPLRSQISLRGDSIPNGSADITFNADSRINLDAETLSVSSYALTGLGLDLSGALEATNIMQEPQVSGSIRQPGLNLRELLNSLAIELPDMADGTTLQNVGLESTFAASADRVEISSLNLSLDQSSLNGNFSLDNAAGGAVTFALNIDNIDLDRYLPPATEEAPEDTAGTGELPLETLRELTLDGQINIGRLLVSELTLSNISATVSAEDGQLAISPLSTELYGGSYLGNIHLDVRDEQPVATLDSALDQVDLGALLYDYMEADYLSGQGNVEFALSGRGLDVPTIKQSLNGSGQVALIDGRLNGVDVGSVLRQLETMIRERRAGQVVRGEYTQFDTFSSSIAISNGVVTTDDLLLESPGFQVNGAGTLIDLNDESLNFNLLTTIDRSTAEDATQQYDLEGYSIPIACTGVASSPRCLPDVGGILQAALGREVERRVGDFLQRALGGDEPQTTEEAAPATEGNQLSEPADEPEADPREELINRALDRLFR